MKNRFHSSKTKSGFGTLPVFLTAISTILGAIMFLRFGYAVGNVGLFYALAIILIGHMITIPTAMAISEIATNQKVEGGGEYFIISRSFGLKIGGAIGIALYFSQAISVAFYVIAFAQAFQPIFDFLFAQFDLQVKDYRWVSLPAVLILIRLIVTKGAKLGVKLLYVVAGVLFVSLLLFFLGDTDHSVAWTNINYFDKVENADKFIIVFAICFPAFTGMTAGVGLSGNLRNPAKSIPLGTLAATFLGMLVYVAIVFKLSLSVSPEDLANDQLVMSRIALWGPIIPIGLAAATISSAIGSFLVAPRTLQALSGDRIFPFAFINNWLEKERKRDNEPVNAALFTSVIAIGFVLINDVNIVARIISMFFMVIYGALCSISFLEHFAADPSYRPTFKSKWYLSLTGAVMCFFLMFQMDKGYAILSISIMILIYLGISIYKKDQKGLITLFQGAILQFSRQVQVYLQKADKDVRDEHWRPSIVCISSHSFNRVAAFDVLKWISYKYGFGTYIHLINGYLSTETYVESKLALAKLISLSKETKSNVYFDTLVSPSYTTAIAQVIQLPGFTGKENNMIMFEFGKNNPAYLGDIINNFQLMQSTDFDICFLQSTEKGFIGSRTKEIHIWITSKDYKNANLMILLGYIILGHPDWKKGSIKLFALYPEQELEEQKEKLMSLVKSGRLSISAKNINVVAQIQNKDVRELINENSVEADLTIVGFRSEAIKHKSVELFNGYDDIGNVLFVNTSKEKEIV
ncbi:MAG: amino acid permease [Cytophagales bacterium]|nr:amino acid permease [Cytophagales bacterium]